MLLATHRVAETTNPDCNRLYLRSKVERSTAPSQYEMAAREKFATVSAAVAARAKDLTKMAADKAAFIAQKDLPGGRTTMKSFLWKLELEAYQG
jgi:hypothetical protein